MLRRRVLSSLVVVLAALIPTVALAAESRPPLAATLPADKTVAYVHLDMGAMLDQANKSLAFIDPTAAGKFAFQVKDLYSMGQELAKSYEFKPALLDHFAELDFYVVVLTKDKPEEETITIGKAPAQGDAAKAPGDSEAQTQTERHYYTASLVIRTPSEEMATDFVQQCKALLDRQKEKHPEAGLERKDIQVDKGQLVGMKEGGMTVGCLGDTVIVSNGNPKELWAALMAPPEKKLVDSPAYQKLMAGTGGSPQAMGMVNVGDLIHRAETSLKQAVDDATKAAGQGNAQDGQDAEGGMGGMRLQMTQMAYNAFLTFQKLFSLDKLEWAGGGVSIAADENHTVSTTYGMLSHGEPISPLLKEILSGSGSFQPPAIGKSDNMAVLVRVDVGSVLNGIVDALSNMDGPVGMAVKMQLQSMKAQLGVGLDDLLKLTASDSYVYVDVAEKDVDTPSVQIDEKTHQPTQVMKKVHTVVPDVTVFLGLKDPKAASDTIGGLVTKLSADPQFNTVVKKRTYQDTDVYCFGEGVTEQENYPDGKSSFAFVIIDRYLTFGSWDDVTKAIRQLSAAQSKTDPALMAVVQANPDANLLVVMPKAFQLKNQQMMAKMEGDQSAFAMMTKALDSVHLGLEDQQLEQRIKTALGELIKAYQALSEKAVAVSPDMVVVKGAASGDYYEVSSKTEMKK